MSSHKSIVLESDLSGRSALGRGWSATRRSAWAWLWAGLGLIVALDLLIALVQPSPAVEAVLADDLPQARAALARAKAHPDGWLLVGDSVLAGDVMQGVVPRWSEHRVLDYLRHERADHEDVGFEQIALDGLLPVDMLRIIRELDVLDPAGRVGVVLELNPRFFSTHYAEQRSCSREFLCKLGITPHNPPRWAWIVVLGHQSWQWVGEHLPLWRHRELFPKLGSAEQEALLPRQAAADAPSLADDPLVGRARILEHYRGLVVGGRSRQYQALDSVVERLRARGRRALLFTTPLNDGFMRGTLEGQAYGDYVGALDRLVNRPGDAKVRFMSLDHPSLPDASFLDHAHLRPEGNRWLALNLLHQLGVGLAEVPPRGTLAYEEGPDRSLLAGVERGNREGAPWQARLRRPDGIAVAAGGQRVVVADTGNHCVRELVGPLATLRTLAGQCGRKGGLNGKLRRAKLHAPRMPVLVGERVYVVDGKGQDKLRELDIAADATRTIKPKGAVRWSRIVAMRGDAHDLWIIDDGARLLRVDPRRGEASVRLDEPESALVALDLGPDGRIYLADADGRLWQLSPGDADPVLLFANEAPALLPQEEGDFFPFGFDELALDHVVDLRYVDRYDALLVQDEHRVDRRGKGVTERVHLRLVSPRERKVYPWVHPLVHGGGYMFHNRHSGALSSNVHRGSMALDPDSATLFYVEHDRTRLLELGDGLLGVAKLGHHVTPHTFGGFKDVFGIQAGQSTLLDHHPERWAHHRLEPLPRRGPYLGLLLGSSMTSVTEVVGQYSLGRVMERELVQALGVRDGIRFDLVQRSYRGPRLDGLVARFESFVEQQAPLDVVFFEVHSGRMLGRYDRKSAMVPAIDRIRRAAQRYGTLVVILDNDAMTSARRDGLRASVKRTRELYALCEEAGFLVLRPSDLLLRESIDYAPWGNAPFTGTHGSTWAMDRAGEAFAALVEPALREHLRGRVPALMRPRAAVIEAQEPLYPAFTGVHGDWAARLRRVPGPALQRELDGAHLQLLVDLGKAGVEGELAAGDADALVLAYLVEALVRDPAGRLADTVTISLVRFGNYDEYGEGVLEGAQVVERRQLDRAALDAFVASMSTPHPSGG